MGRCGTKTLVPIACCAQPAFFTILLRPPIQAALNGSAPERISRRDPHERTPDGALRRRAGVVARLRAQDPRHSRLRDHELDPGPVAVRGSRLQRYARRIPHRRLVLDAVPVHCPGRFLHRRRRPAQGALARLRDLRCGARRHDLRANGLDRAPLRPPAAGLRGGPADPGDGGGRQALHHAPAALDGVLDLLCRDESRIRRCRLCLRHGARRSGRARCLHRPAPRAQFEHLPHPVLVEHPHHPRRASWSSGSACTDPTGAMANRQGRPFPRVRPCARSSTPSAMC